MKAKKIVLVVGARPNFMKAAPLIRALRLNGGFDVQLVHTGQHFDDNMSKVFFTQLSLPRPDAFLNVNTGSPASQVANMMIALQDLFNSNPPSLVVVFGDVNSTLAAAIAANKMRLPLAHVEAGLRSFDRRMPEEHNRIVVDMLSDYLFTPSKDADENLLKESISTDRIFRVGNIMVDSLLAFRSRALELKTLKAYGLEPKGFALVTLHRQANVDDLPTLEAILAALIEIAKEMPVIFPAHPRTKIQLGRLQDRLAESTQLKIVAPLNYLEFLNLMMHANLILTDSGGIQEESTFLWIPCITLRDNTERPITISQGTNRLAGTKTESILRVYREVMHSRLPERSSPELWDGKTAERIVDILCEIDA